MLKTLQKRSRDERQQLVARLAASLLPNPDIDDDQLAMSPEPFDAMLAEIKQELNIHPADDPSKARLRLYDYLTRLMARLVLPNDEISEVRSRVGERGALPPQFYDIRYTENFEKSAKHAVSKHQIVETLKDPDYYDHLYPPEGGKQMSLFAKIQRPVKADPYTLLVLSERKGAIQTVYNAWPVFPPEADHKAVTSAMDILKRLVDTYGMEFTILGFPTKLLIGEVIHASEGMLIGYSDGSIDLGPKAFDVKGLGPGEEMRSVVVLKIEGDEVNVALAFAINMDKYYADLRRHGFQIEE
jgi:hypothetical protein